MLVTLDFESFYDESYTLKKLSTSEYIRDPRFQAISCAIKVGDSPTRVHWGQEEIQNALDCLPWGEVELLCHHTQFDGLVLSHHFGKVPRTYRDTLSMARLLYPKGKSNKLEELTVRLGVQNKLPMPDFKGKKLWELTQQERNEIAEYNVGDVDSCLAAYRAMLPRVPAEELDLIDITVRMFSAPELRLDVPKAVDELLGALNNRAAMIARTGMTEKDLGSAAKVAAALEALNVPVPMKYSKKQKNPDGSPKLVPAFAQTDLEFTALVNHPDPVVSALVEARLEVKSTISLNRPARLLKAGVDLPLPVYLNYCGAHTTRWSGGDKLNFQNFPRGSELRKCLLAPPGQVLVVVDSSQIEVRVLAWLAGERWLLDAFAKGYDPYIVFGTRAYGRQIVKGDPERQLAKVCVLGLGYGMGAVKLQLTFAWGTLGPAVEVSIEQCESFVNMYRSSSPAIAGRDGLWAALQDLVGDMAKGRPGELKCLSWEKDAIHLPNGTTLHYPGCEAEVQVRGGGIFGGHRREVVLDGSYESYGGGRSKIYGGLLTENVVQALARVVVAEQMRQIAQRYRVVMMSHDEVVFLAPEAQAQEALAFGMQVMRVRPTWAPDLPLDVEGGFDVRYSK